MAIQTVALVYCRATHGGNDSHVIIFYVFPQNDFYWNTGRGILVCNSKRSPTALKEAYHKNGPSVGQFKVQIDLCIVLFDTQNQR